MGFLRLKWILIGLFLLSMPYFLNPAPIASERQGPKLTSFRMALNDEPPTLDWNLATDGVSFLVITNLMEGLTEYDQDLNAKASIAKRWTVSEDGLIYTFYLRKDVYWSDGLPVTASDFEYSWKRLLSPATAAEYAYFLYDIKNAYEYNTGQLTDASQVGVKALSPGVLEVQLKKPVVYFPSITTFMVTFPIRRDIIEKYGDRWTEPDHIVTNGPFQLSEWRHEYRLTLQANPHYYGNPVHLDQILYFVINEPTTALTLYETGDLEMVDLPPEAIPTYRGSPEHLKKPLLRGYYYGFNIEKFPFNDVRIRRAFSMAINRKEIPRILKGGEAATSSWIPEGVFGYNPTIGLPFNPEKARSLLKKGGYPEGKNFPEITISYNTGAVNRLIAENVQEQLRRTLGIRVLLDNQEWKVYLKRLKVDTPSIFRLGWGADYPDPDNFMVLFHSRSGNNNTHWGSEEYDRLIARAAIEKEREKRQFLYDEAQRLLLEKDAVIVPLFTAVKNVLVKPYVIGLELNSMELLYLKKVKLLNQKTDR